MPQNKLKEILTEYLNEYFQSYASSKKEIGGVIHLAKYQEEILDKKIENLLSQSSILLSAKVMDYSAENEECTLWEIKPIKFLFPFNSEDKLVELNIETGPQKTSIGTWLGEYFKCDKTLFNPKYINEDCDIELMVNGFYLTSHPTPVREDFKIINICHQLTLCIYDAEILKINQLNERWLNANYFGNELKQIKKVTEVKRKGCLSFFSKF
jgi:hypothetical protein